MMCAPKIVSIPLDPSPTLDRREPFNTLRLSLLCIAHAAQREVLSGAASNGDDHEYPSPEWLARRWGRRNRSRSGLRRQGTNVNITQAAAVDRAPNISPTPASVGASGGVNGHGIRNESICRLCQATIFCNSSSTLQKHSGRQGAASHIPFWPWSSPCRGRILLIAANTGRWGIVSPYGKYVSLTPRGQDHNTPLPY
jgi:hypothetical protein